MRRLAVLTVLLISTLSAAHAEKVWRGPQLHYAVHCQGCHLHDGSGTPGKIPALKGSVGFFMGVPGGKDYMLRVPGAANAPLNDHDLAALLNWMVEEFGHDLTPQNWPRYTEQEVAAQRRIPLVDLEKTRAELVRAGTEDRLAQRSTQEAETSSR